jgi:Myb/SANT-like DNA-binding domain
MAQKVRAQWNDTRDFFVIQHLLQAARRGRKSDTGFKKDVWHELTTAFAVKFGLTLHVGQFQSRMKSVVLLSLVTNCRCIRITRLFGL